MMGGANRTGSDPPRILPHEPQLFSPARGRFRPAPKVEKGPWRAPLSMSLRARLAWLWTLVILVLCWIPRSILSIHEKGPKPFFVPNFDKLVHLGIFAV